MCAILLANPMIEMTTSHRCGLYHLSNSTCQFHAHCVICKDTIIKIKTHLEGIFDHIVFIVCRINKFIIFSSFFLQIIYLQRACLNCAKYTLICIINFVHSNLTPSLILAHMAPSGDCICIVHWHHFHHTCHWQPKGASHFHLVHFCLSNIQVLVQMSILGLKPTREWFGVDPLSPHGKVG